MSREWAEGGGPGASGLRRSSSGVSYVTAPPSRTAQPASLRRKLEAYRHVIAVAEAGAPPPPPPPPQPSACPPSGVGTRGDLSGRRRERTLGRLPAAARRARGRGRLSAADQAAAPAERGVRPVTGLSAGLGGARPSRPAAPSKRHHSRTRRARLTCRATAAPRTAPAARLRRCCSSRCRRWRASCPPLRRRRRRRPQRTPSARPSDPRTDLR